MCARSFYTASIHFLKSNHRSISSSFYHPIPFSLYPFLSIPSSLLHFSLLFLSLIIYLFIHLAWGSYCDRRDDKNVVHIQIVNHGDYYGIAYNEGERFATLTQLVDFYKGNYGTVSRWCQ